MQELAEFARSDALRNFIFDPPPFLSPRNGVAGVALSYDSMLVAEVVRRASYPGGLPSRTIEFSTHIAAKLAAIAGPLTYGATSSRIEDQELIDWWIDISNRVFGRQMSPIVVEITLSPEFPRHVPGSLSDFVGTSEIHRVIFRRARESVLHHAEGGGRFIPVGTIPRGLPPWGTLGGFVQRLDDQQLYAVTAAHVAVNTHGDGTPAVLLGDAIGFRPLINMIASVGPHLLLRRSGWERGRIAKTSHPDPVAPFDCQPSQHPTTAGLDVALAAWPNDDRANRRQVAVASPGQISQEVPLYFSGARSGKQKVRIASYSIWHSYASHRGGGPFVCVADCLQIKLPERPVVRESVSRGGDSGAWLMAEGKERLHWVGLLVGGDGDRSGIVPADRIIRDFEAQLGKLQPMI